MVLAKLSNKRMRFEAKFHVFQIKDENLSRGENTGVARYLYVIKQVVGSHDNIFVEPLLFPP